MMFSQVNLQKSNFWSFFPWTFPFFGILNVLFTPTAYWRPLTRILVGPLILWFWLAFGGFFLPYPAIPPPIPTAKDKITLDTYLSALQEEKDHLGFMADLDHRVVDTSHTWDIRKIIIGMASSIYDFVIRHFGWILGTGKLSPKDLPSAPEKILDKIGLERVDIWNTIGGPFVPSWEHPVLIDWEGKLLFRDT